MKTSAKDRNNIKNNKSTKGLTSAKLLGAKDINNIYEAVEEKWNGFKVKDCRNVKGEKIIGILKENKKNENKFTL